MPGVNGIGLTRLVFGVAAFQHGHRGAAGQSEMHRRLFRVRGRRGALPDRGRATGQSGLGSAALQCSVTSAAAGSFGRWGW